MTSDIAYYENKGLTSAKVRQIRRLLDFFISLLGETAEFEVGDGLVVRVLNLTALIRIKAETAQEKDNYQLAILRRTAEERAKK